MSADALSLLGGLLSAFWHLFTGWYLPGTNVTPAAFGLAILFIHLLVRRLVRMFDTQSTMKGRGEDE